MSNALQRLVDNEPALIAWFDDFDGPNEFAALSNFYEGDPLYIPVVDDTFATGEHAFAAMKAVRHDQYLRIRNAGSPGAAKHLGRICELREDWEVVKLDVMMAILRAKFARNREEGLVLLSTRDALLVEGTYWDDRVWGVSLAQDNNPLYAPGRNWLGTLLMARRAELRAEVYFSVSHPTVAYNAQFMKRGYLK